MSARTCYSQCWPAGWNLCSRDRTGRVAWQAPTLLNDALAWAEPFHLLASALAASSTPRPEGVCPGADFSQGAGVFDCHAGTT